MRVVVHEYANGGQTTFETVDDGGELLAEWSGKYTVGERIRAWIDVGCDNTEQGVECLLAAMARLADEIRKRKLSGNCVGAGTAADHQS
jgi:hypothetical protein